MFITRYINNILIQFNIVEDKMSHEQKVIRSVIFHRYEATYENKRNRLGQCRHNH